MSYASPFSCAPLSLRLPSSLLPSLSPFYLTPLLLSFPLFLCVQRDKLVKMIQGAKPAVVAINAKAGQDARGMKLRVGTWIETRSQ